MPLPNPILEFVTITLWPFTMLAFLNVLFVRNTKSVVLFSILGTALALAYLFGQFNF